MPEEEKIFNPDADRENMEWLHQKKEEGKIPVSDEIFKILNKEFPIEEEKKDGDK